MDELSMIREIGADTPEPEPLALQRARTKLLDAADLERRRPMLRRPLVRIGIVAAAAALVTGGVVVSDTFWRDDNNQVVGAATAAEVLRDAADAAIRHEDPVVGEDQYLKVTNTARYANDHIFEAGQLGTDVTTTWIPGDPNALWVRRSEWDPALGRPTEVKRARDGEFVPGELGGGTWGQPTPAFLAELPRDVAELKARLSRDNDVELTDHVTMLWEIALVLESGMVPADLRATMFSLLESLPGIEILDESAEIGGRTGVAIGYPGTPPASHRQELIVDPDNGLVLGDRSIATADTTVWENGDLMHETTIATEVVDEAP